MTVFSPLASMTGFSRAQGELEGIAWAWELRSVNGRGLDVKLRLPGGLDVVEPALREAAGKTLKRGNVSGTLTIKREAASGMMADPAALEGSRNWRSRLPMTFPAPCRRARNCCWACRA